MNKKFLQSVAAGIATLSIVASCSHLGANKESNNCGAKNGCAAKKDEAHKCSANKCAAKAEVKATETKEVAPAKEVKKETKKVKKAKKAKKAEVKAETKTEEKKN